MKTSQEIVSFINVSTPAEDIRQYQKQSRKAAIERQTMTKKTLWTLVGMLSGGAMIAAPMFYAISILMSYPTATVHNDYYPYNIILGLVLVLTGAALIPYYIQRRAEQRIPLAPVDIKITSRISDSQHLLRLETVAAVAGKDIVVDEMVVDNSDELVAVAARTAVRDQQASIDATAWANSATKPYVERHIVYPQFATAADVDVAQRLLRQ